MAEWGPLPTDVGFPSSEKEQQQGRANQALLGLILDARCHLGSEVLRGYVPSKREDFERARVEFHGKIDDALMGRGSPSYLHDLADQIAILKIERILHPCRTARKQKMSSWNASRSCGSTERTGSPENNSSPWFAQNLKIKDARRLAIVISCAS